MADEASALWKQWAGVANLSNKQSVHIDRRQEHLCSNHAGPMGIDLKHYGMVKERFQYWWEWSSTVCNLVVLWYCHSLFCLSRTACPCESDSSLHPCWATSHVFSSLPLHVWPKCIQCVCCLAVVMPLICLEWNNEECSCDKYVHDTKCNWTSSTIVFLSACSVSCCNSSTQVVKVI